jgi:hypothetical protein
MRRAVRSASFACVLLIACLDGRGTIVVDGAGGAPPEADPGDDGPGLDLGGDGDADGDPDGFGGGDGDADADADADSDGPGGDADADIAPGGDADADGDVEPACVQPEGPFGNGQDDVLADFPQPLPECGTGDLETLFSYCESGAIVIHFNSPG